MKRIKLLCLTLALMFISAAGLFAQDVDKDQYHNGKLRMVIVGSSVAYGSGADEGKGWSRLLESKLESTGHWEVINKSIGGNRTSDVLGRLDRDVLAFEPDVVVIGLSLANEGFGGNGDLQAIYTSFNMGMKKIVQVLQANNIVPVVANCYANSNFGPDKYRYTRQMNFEINNWPIASINLLSAIDNGKGQWSQGHFQDAGHPNNTGHSEMYYNIPVSMFDTLIGSPLCDAADSDAAIALDGTAASAPLVCSIANEMHSCTVAFEFKPNVIVAGPIAALGSDSAIVVNENGQLEYVSGENKITSATTIEVGNTYHIAIARAYNETFAELYVNGECIGKCSQPAAAVSSVLLGGSSQQAYGNAQYKDLLIYRGALNPDEMKYIFEGGLLKSSIQLYSPLYDIIVEKGSRMINLAPSSSYVIINDDTCSHVSKF